MTRLEAGARIARFVDDEAGATAIEYGMIAALLALAIISIVFTIGSTISSTFYGPLVGAMTGT